MSDEPVFLVGDVVQLKSGGPKMTVSYVSESGEIEVIFASENGYYAFVTTVGGAFINVSERARQENARLEKTKEIMNRDFQAAGI